MPPPFPVLLADYDPDWLRRAGHEADRLKVLGPVLVAVHHVGSTAVPGLPAKPVIDLVPVVGSLEALERQRAQFEDLGYVGHGEFGIPGRSYFTMDDERGVRMVQLHCYPVGSLHIVRHVAFRDYLRAHPAMAKLYEQEKRRAQKLHPNDSHAYTDEKADWVRATEAVALEWFAGERREGSASGNAEPNIQSGG